MTLPTKGMTMFNHTRGGEQYEVYPKNSHTDAEVKKLIDDGKAAWNETTKEIYNNGDAWADFKKFPVIRP
jgi:hypothetical protein